MRDVDIVDLCQIWKTVQAITCNSDDFCTSCKRTIFKVWSNDIKHGSLQNFWMTRNRTKTTPKVSLLQHNGMQILLGTEDIGNMETFDPLDVSSSSKSGKWHQNVVRQSHNVTMSINKSRLTLLLLRIQDWHQQRRLHINSSVEMEDSSKTILNYVV